VTRLHIHQDQIFASWRENAAKMAKISQDEILTRNFHQDGIFARRKFRPGNFQTKFSRRKFLAEIPAKKYAEKFAPFLRPKWPNFCGKMGGKMGGKMSGKMSGKWLENGENVAILAEKYIEKCK
jgi:hypothetical protein